jgi:hypothetical protein
VSAKWVLPPSMTMSPVSSSGSSWASTSSTGLPALTSIRIRRGFSRAATNSGKVGGPTMFRPALAAMKFLRVFWSRFHTAMENPWSLMLRARLRPITASPSNPKSALAVIYVSPSLPDQRAEIFHGGSLGKSLVNSSISAAS